MRFIKRRNRKKQHQRNSLSYPSVPLISLFPCFHFDVNWSVVHFWHPFIEVDFKLLHIFAFANTWNALNTLHCKRPSMKSTSTFLNMLNLCRRNSTEYAKESPIQTYSYRLHWTANQRKVIFAIVATDLYPPFCPFHSINWSKPEPQQQQQQQQNPEPISIRLIFMCLFWR